MPIYIKTVDHVVQMYIALTSEYLHARVMAIRYLSVASSYGITAIGSQLSKNLFLSQRNGEANTFVFGRLQYT